MLSGFGGMIAWAGWGAIHRQHYEMEWRAGGTLGGGSHGTLAFDGAEATRFGTGLTSFGLMLIAWALAIAVGLAHAAKKQNNSPLSRAIAWLSLACLLLAFTCFFPPWRLPNATFYAVVVLVLSFAFALPDATRQAWNRTFFPALIATSILVATLNTAAGLGMVLGLLVSLVIVVHAFLIFPRLQDKLLPPASDA
jgi:hypothetical protein